MTGVSPNNGQNFYFFLARAESYVSAVICVQLMGLALSLSAPPTTNIWRQTIPDSKETFHEFKRFS